MMLSLVVKVTSILNIQRESTVKYIMCMMEFSADIKIHAFGKC
jgi:hypothetical protein